ncbi:hypothetical protein VSR34_24810 [Paraburkholderia sp. JHI2823]|uniref:hypothetical protein n=1 Tax=Paraburkholderia TaxID=1822464 RepID=UPI000424DE20|nr:hypothetical protein [Paraburkholderia mimosarum]
MPDAAPLTLSLYWLAILSLLYAVPDGVQTLNGRHFVTDRNRILAQLTERHSFPKVH